MEIRKLFTVIEESRSEMGKSDDGTDLRKVGVVAVVKNPMAGQYHEDLSLLIEESEEVAHLITQKAVMAMGEYQAESYGKAAVVGTGGEQEHGVAMLTTVFGNILRDSVGGGKAWVSSMTKRATAGHTIDIPLAFKDALYVRSHYDGMSITLHDAPLEDEIAVICCIANRGRINARVGGLTTAEAKKEDGLV
ncbi:amino acid synthesis family protein [Alteribacillus sp. YIM 98480]|uniref:amino acid synthesis family protein n=1 Tax=Alteribacillus sp. YIM 98480 TaxID=2606599 RepID=UPI00131CD04A|nr:amino acid synthesis family protein [Alteribacillus sp. YIM 98480]